MLGKEAREVRSTFTGAGMKELENVIDTAEDDDVVPVIFEMVVATAVAKVVLEVVNVLAVSPSNVSASRAGSDSESGSGSGESSRDG